jgi:hypothetical protein
VDLKADRAGGALVAQAAWVEPGRDHRVVAPALAEHLRLMAGWLELGAIEVRPKGDLAPALERSI